MTLMHWCCPDCRKQAKEHALSCLLFHAQAACLGIISQPHRIGNLISSIGPSSSDAQGLKSADDNHIVNYFHSLMHERLQVYALMLNR